MHILLATIGSVGDVHPVLNLGLALKKRGHKVTVITNPYFKTKTEKVGLNFIKLGEKTDYEKASKHPAIWHPKKGLKLLAKTVVKSTEPLYRIIEKEQKKEDCLVIATALCFGARIARDKLNTPLVTIHMQPSLFRSFESPPTIPGAKLPNWLLKIFSRLIYRNLEQTIDAIIAPKINQFRKKLGLKPIKQILNGWTNSPDLIIGLFPSWFAKKQSDWPKNTKITNFSLLKSSKTLNKTDRKTLNLKPPAIIFTAGTAMKHGRQFFKESVKACQRLKTRGILVTTDPRNIPKKLPNGITHLPYLPFDKALPKAAAIVHHGGIGTSATALRAGTPQLIMPMGFDQPDNANRLEKLGVALQIKAKHYRVKILAQKLHDLLNSKKIQNRCKAIAKKAQKDTSMKKTCQIIESFMQ
jgi:rhamnosyltransferase subunit B